MSSILLAAAGSTQWDEEARLLGSRSLPLSEGGRQEVSDLASQLAGTPFRIIYTGHSRHCLESARILAHSGRRRRVRCLDDLCEVDQGLWEGLPLAEIERCYARAYRAWLRDPEAVRPPEGETIAHAYQRVRQALARIARRHKGHTVAIVAPRLLRALIQCCLHGRGPEAVWDLYRTDVQWEVLSVPDSVVGRA